MDIYSLSKVNPKVKRLLLQDMTPIAQFRDDWF
jgi:hypothetical protein